MPIGSFIVLNLFSTSNHNAGRYSPLNWPLFYIFFLHQTTTLCFCTDGIWHCFISISYIKPQHYHSSCTLCDIVLYLFPTSNHNEYADLEFTEHIVVLYLFSTSYLNIYILQRKKHWARKTSVRFSMVIILTFLFRQEH